MQDGEIEAYCQEGSSSSRTHLDAPSELQSGAMPARAPTITLAEVQSMGGGKERTGSARRTDTRLEKRAHCTRKDLSACTMVQEH